MQSRISAISRGDLGKHGSKKAKKKEKSFETRLSEIHSILMCLGEHKHAVVRVSLKGN